MNRFFIEGFMKVADPELWISSTSYGDDEHRKKSQEILEGYSRKQRDNKSEKAVKEESPQASPATMMRTGRGW